MLEKSRQRALRRHDNARIRNNRKSYYGYQKYLPVNPGRSLGMLVHTATLCSCEMCGNPRRYYGNNQVAKTIRELSDLEVCNHRDWW